MGAANRNPRDTSQVRRRVEKEFAARSDPDRSELRLQAVSASPMLRAPSRASNNLASPALLRLRRKAPHGSVQEALDDDAGQ
jgi:hypothetical protein